ncbi:MAG: hypothetical protein AAFR46_09240 [Pseudomonadota bacterium]
MQAHPHQTWRAHHIAEGRNAARGDEDHVTPLHGEGGGDLRALLWRSRRLGGFADTMAAAALSVLIVCLFGVT